MVDQTDNDLFLTELPMSIKQEMVNEGSINHVSDGGVHFMWQEIVNEDSIDRVSDGGVTFPVQEMVNQDADSSDAPKDGGVRQRK